MINEFLDWLKQFIAREIFSVVVGGVALFALVAGGYYLTKPILWVMDQLGFKESYIRRRTGELSGFAILILLITFCVTILLVNCIRSGKFGPIIAVSIIGAYFFILSKIKAR